MNRLIIIRHCETIGNSKGEMQGYFQDSDFTENGRKQINKLIEHLKNEKIEAVFCSDLGRAFKTAEAIAKSHNLNPTPLKDLRECDIGDWRNLPVKEGISKWIEFYEEQKKLGKKREEIRPPNGENSFDHQKRIMKCVDEILKNKSNSTIAIVGHSGTNRVLIGTFQNTDPDDFYKIGQENACINIIEIEGNKSNIVSINDTQHLI